ncbi:MAG: V4R domain-containing protein [Byssovorax sp.]
MLDLARPIKQSPFDPRRVDDLSDAELDALPFGVIALDEEGTVLRYNLYESRLARLDRNQVVGRNFFGDVAYCARTEAFEGRFRTFTAHGTEGEIVRFDFVFDFKFGAQTVVIELIRAADAPRWYLLVNRTSVAPPRPAFPVEMLAAEQRDLAPDEAVRGVIRDELERRVVDAPAPFFAALRARGDRLAPETWQLFATEWGVQWGRRTAVDLEASVLESGGHSLRDVPMREVARLVSTYLAERGWGSTSFDFALTTEGLLVIELERSALAEAAPRAPRTDSSPHDDLACHIVAGCLSGILSSVGGRRLAAREVACVAGGASRCAIVLVAHERRAAIDAALGEGCRGVEAIRAALRRAPRGIESTR